MHFYLSKYKSYKSIIKVKLRQLTKQIYGVRRNSKQGRLYEAIDIPWSEELFKKIITAS